MNERCEDNLSSQSLAPNEHKTGLEEELLRTRRQLATAVERSEDLVQRIIEAESAKREFMAHMSYVIRPPLNAIIGCSEILTHEGVSESQRQYISIIQKNAGQLLDLVVNSVAGFFEIEEEELPVVRHSKSCDSYGQDSEHLPSTVSLQDCLAADTSTDLDPTLAVDPSGRFSGHVLVADDNRCDRMIARRLLSILGVKVTAVDHGAEVVEIVRNHSFDMIFLDMEMPVKNGYETIRELRASGMMLPIVALTAHAMEADRTKCLAAGCDDYLAKPIDKTELLRILAAHLEENEKQPAHVNTQSVAEIDLDGNMRTPKTNSPIQTEQRS